MITRLYNKHKAFNSNSKLFILESPQNPLRRSNISCLSDDITRFPDPHVNLNQHYT